MRLRQVRFELYGAGARPALAWSLGLPERTWANYEAGVAVPALVLLVFLDLTDVEPRWLLSGAGPRYRALPVGDGSPVAAGVGPPP